MSILIITTLSPDLPIGGTDEIVYAGHNVQTGEYQRKDDGGE